MAQAEMITCTLCGERAYGLVLRLCQHCSNGYCEECHSNYDYCPNCVHLTCHGCLKQVDRGKHIRCDECSNNFCKECFFDPSCNICAKKTIRDDVEEYFNWNTLGEQQSEEQIEDFLTWLYKTYNLEHVYNNTERIADVKKLHQEYMQKPKNPELSSAKIGKILWVK